MNETTIDLRPQEPEISIKKTSRDTYHIITQNLTPPQVNLLWTDLGWFSIRYAWERTLNTAVWEVDRKFIGPATTVLFRFLDKMRDIRIEGDRKKAVPY